MDGISEELFYYFPKLREDPLFRVTSPDTFAYNCIAWAMSDIRHSLHALEGDIYGNVAVIMQRKK